MLKKTTSSSSSSCSLKKEKPIKAGDKPVIKETKQVPKAGKLGKEIDDIFGGRKKKKPDVVIPENKETKAKIAKRKRKRIELDDNNPRSCLPRRKTEEGYRVYTPKEIGWGRLDAGGTPLCPFDCGCCF